MRFDAFAAHDPRLVTVAALAVVALAVAVAVGVVPATGAAAIALLVPAAVIDVEQRRLPDVWVGAALVVLVAALAVESAFVHPVPGDVIRGSVGGALAMTLPVLLLHLVAPASMGFGDVKAAVVLGAAVGTVDWRLGAVALCLAAVSGAGLGVVTQQRTIAFGPFLVFGAWCSLLGNDLIVNGVFAGGTAP
jgi:leader peptidase (prepilin peptidase)/N-methyltransferase